MEGEAIPALNRLFAKCPRLEYLHISGPSPAAGQLKLPAQLVYLLLHESHPFISELLNVENCKAMAPTLRALRLIHQEYESPSLPPHLGLLVNLTFLGVETGPKSEAVLLSAFPTMTQLKALEVDGVDGDRLLKKLPELCSQLEHLSLTLGKPPAMGWIEKLVQLRTLIVTNQGLDWSWLEPLIENGRLEYVVAGSSSTVFPTELVTELIRKSPVGE